MDGVNAHKKISWEAKGKQGGPNQEYKVTVEEKD